MNRVFVAFVAALGASALVRGDSWVFPDKLVKRSFDFGRTKVVLEVDGTKDRGFPPHILSVYADGALAAKYRKVGFEHLYVSKDKRYFVGLSNEGIPGTAFVIFDAEGNLLREVKHAHMPYGIYTDTSVTLIRKWFEAQRPVKFKVEEGRLVGVLVWGTRVKQYDLLQADLGFEDTDNFEDTEDVDGG
jgi:hypothetical protein